MAVQTDGSRFGASARETVKRGMSTLGVYGRAVRDTAQDLAAPAAGTKITETLQPVCWRASQTVSKTGTLPSNICPPFPGVTPATTFVRRGGVA